MKNFNYKHLQDAVNTGETPIFPRAVLLFLLLLLAFCLVHNHLVFADVVFFEDESRFPVEGSLLEDGDFWIISLADGSKIKVKKSEVKKIEKGKTLDDIFNERYEKINKKSVDELFELAQWCISLGMEGKKARLYVEILKLNPDEERVHKELGHILVNGKWVNPETIDEFGQGIPHTLKDGEFILKPFAWFNVKTDTSPDLAQYMGSYLESFMRAIADEFCSDIELKKKSDVAQVFIFKTYEEYAEYVEKCSSPIARKHKSKSKFIPAKYSCFINPSSGDFATYLFKFEFGEPSFRNIINKIAGYMVFSLAYSRRNLRDCSRAMFEAFASTYQYAFITRDGSICHNHIPKFMLYKMAEAAPRLENLLGIDSDDYYLKDMSVHRVLCFSFGYYCLLSGNSDNVELFRKMIEEDRKKKLTPEKVEEMFDDAFDFDSGWEYYVNKLIEAIKKK